MRALRGLVLLALLLPALPAHADLSEADGMLGISAQGLPWMVQFPAQGYTLSVQRHREDGRGHYYLLSHATTGLNVSFYLEPAEVCTTAEACREGSWQHRHPSMANATGVARFTRNGFALLECTVTFTVPEALGRTVEQHHFSGHLVRDGYWVDMHLSKMPYAPRERQTFLDFVDAIKIEPKGH